ncbi:hypothetical protein [[Clostridium] polysaccharolyticum]|uniref:Uncharacterized protein n=1 Tax=[Clostridium] polysaccharolyticum TaxID=29364 RepID=A0A1H9YJT5_9FIRM|nr:hypothetical protein [[Clostridium] polysaccharolyticum]SES69333.1 hypothetical protein SAMN04487772_10257 [[Clostridium] polysaccharolyticum]
MGLIEFCKRATQRKSRKIITKRKVEEFRGCGKECTAEQLIEAFHQQPVISSLGEVLSLDLLLTAKGNKFKFELLHKDFEAAAYILSKVYSAPDSFRFYKKWLLVSGTVISCNDIDRIVRNRIKQSETVTSIVKKAIEVVKENWIVDKFPNRTGECFETTMYATSDTEFQEPYVHTCEYLGDGKWDSPSGFYVAAWKIVEPYVPGDVNSFNVR